MMGPKTWVWVCAICLLQGCASSRLSRGASEQAQDAFASGDTAAEDVGTVSPGRAWQASSQVTKGLLIGGATGGVAGGLTSGIGWVPGALGGAVFGGAIGAWIDANSSSRDQLLNQGASVMILGDQIRVVLLSSDVFDGYSATISPHAYKALNGVVQLIAQYPNRRVMVAAYSDPGDPEHASEAFTRAQADSVMRYLWHAGVNTRLLYAAGYGARNPVAQPGGDHPADNCRVEITLEKLPI